MELCPVSSLALHFVYRFHIAKEKRPDFTSRKKWYNRYVLKGIGEDETRYIDQRDAIIQGFEAFGIDCSKKTHLGRDRGVADCAHIGVKKEDMERQGLFFSFTTFGEFLTF